MELDLFCMDSLKPSTSKNYSTKDEANIINELNESELNESLEAFSKTYNLTTQNVKNIIFVSF